MKSTTTVRRHLTWRQMCSESQRQRGMFLRSVCVLLTRSFLQTGSEWQGGTELPQSTGSHGSKQTGMANTNTNTTVSLHWNVAAPAHKLARVRNSGIKQTDKTDEVSDSDEANMWQSEKSRQQVEKSFVKHFGVSVTDLLDIFKREFCEFACSKTTL